MSFSEDPTTSGWWYRENDEQDAIGPVTEAVIRQRARGGEITADTFVWHASFGEEWKPYRELPGSQLSPPPADDPKWQEVFAKFDAGERGPKTISILGFLFGPLYYFYLRMWRKGLAIIGIALCGTAVVDLLHVLVGLPSPAQKLVALAANAFCMSMAKRDYYMFKRHDEVMWPQIGWLKSRIALTAVIVVPLLVSIGLDAAADSSDTPSKASASRSNTAQPFVSSAKAKSATWRESDGGEWKLDPKTYDSQHKAAEKNCAQWLEQQYGGNVANQYDRRTVYTYKVVVHGGDIIAQSLYFGGHPTMPMGAQLHKFTNGWLDNTINLPEEVCVLNPNMQVVGTEVSMEAGLK